MSKIVRRPDRAEGGITPEEEVLLKEHANKWIAIAMRTEPIEHDKITPAIQGLYQAAGLKIPEVIIVPSPLALAITYGFLAAATYAKEQLHQAITLPAVQDIVRGITAAVSLDVPPPGWARKLAQEFAPGNTELQQLMLDCVPKWWNNYQGGNMWSAYPCYLSAGRDVLKLQLPEYEKFQYWEQAAIHGGFRAMHPDFCIVSDFPEVLTKDDQNRPHGATGPSHKWRDGWALYYWHGVRVTKQIIESPDTLTVEQMQNETNAEVKRIMIERYGASKYLLNAGARKLHEDDYGTLYHCDIKDDEPLVMVKVVNSTPETDGSYKDYWLRVHRELRPMLTNGGVGDPQAITARNAVASTFGMTGEEYVLTKQT